MDLIISPYVGVGKIEFGMTKENVTEIINSKLKRCQELTFGPGYKETYEFCHIYYDKKGHCEAIEFFEPANPLFFGERLMSQPFSQVRQLIKDSDELIRVDETGLTSFKFGIGVYVPFWDDDEEDTQVEGVIVFKKGYYDR
jgi:hypothetical protein